MTFIVDKHADDYGISENSSNIIYQLCKSKKLNSISIMPNMAHFNDVISKAKELKDEGICISAHINILEGKCLSDPKEIPRIVDKNGMFKNFWGFYFFSNYNIFTRKEIKRELKKEISKQLKVVKDKLELETLRIDSHQHVHMIPIVFESIVEVIDDEKLNVSYIRNSKEPIIPFLKSFKLYSTYQVVNIIKNLILNIYSPQVDKYCADSGMKSMYSWGLIMSGYMDFNRIKELMPLMITYCENNNRNLEMIFHPGKMLPNESSINDLANGNISFYLSDNREIERETLERLGGDL